MKIFSLILLLPVLLFSQEYKKEANNILLSASKEGPGYTAMVSINGKPEYTFATGKANIELNVPMQMEHKFRIGSLTKQFTATAIMILIEQNKIKVSDSIQQYITEFPSKKHTITIEHLLTHTSGIKSYTDPEIMDEKFMRQYHQPDSLINSFSNYPLEFKPGTKFSYNNSGYHLLGLIIERVSKLKFEEFLKVEIFDKAGMKDTRTDSNKELIKNRVSGYDTSANVLNSEYIDMSIPYSAGNLISTVSDLNLWYKALFNYKIVKKETLELALKPYKLSNGKISKYAYGWGFDTIQGQQVILHGGVMAGFLSSTIYFTKQKMLSVVLSNCTCNPAYESSLEIAELAILKHVEK